MWKVVLQAVIGVVDHGFALCVHFTDSCFPSFTDASEDLSLYTAEVMVVWYLRGLCGIYVDCVVLMWTVWYLRVLCGIYVDCGTSNFAII